MPREAESKPLEAELNDLIDLCLGAMRRYQAAYDRWPHPEERDHLLELRAEHTDAMHALDACIRELGGQGHRRAPPARRTLTEARMSFANLAGGRASLVDRLRDKERQLSAAYRDTLTRIRHLPLGHLRTTLEEGLAAQSRHREWLDASRVRRPQARSRPAPTRYRSTGSTPSGSRPDSAAG